MIIRQVELVNFRNHDELRLGFNEKITVITGGNGWGKTSVLEAIYIGLCGRSFRGVDSEIVRREAEFYKIRLALVKNGVVVRYKDARKNFEVGGKRTARLPKQHRYPVVLFLPSDLHLVGSSPNRRRDYFDGLLSLMSETYHKELVRHNKALKQRNGALKQSAVTPEMVFSWDVMLARSGAYIRRERSRLTEVINERFSGVYRGIAGQNDEVELKLYAELADESDYMGELERGFARDKMTGHTGYGAHKDRYEFYFNGELADGNASRGETRSMILALKFIEAELLEQEMGRKPLVLLDDVFSELDEVRQKKLVENFKNNQVIITSVRSPS